MIVPARPSPAASFRLVPSAKFHQPGEEEAFLRALPIESNEVTRVIDLGEGGVAGVVP